MMCYKQLVSPRDDLLTFIHETADINYESLFKLYDNFAAKMVAADRAVLISSINHKLRTTKNYIFAASTQTPAASMSVFEMNKIVKAAVLASEDKTLPMFVCDEKTVYAIDRPMTHEDIEVFTKVLVVDAATKVAEPARTCVCGKKGNLFRCGRCKLAYYCGVDCQRKDYPRHAEVCMRVKIAAV